MDALHPVTQRGRAFNFWIPEFAPGARTAVMPIGVPQDTADNNCRTLSYHVWFPNGDGWWEGSGGFLDEG